MNIIKRNYLINSKSVTRGAMTLNLRDIKSSFNSRAEIKQGL